MTSDELKKFLDKTGLTYFWSRIKSYVDESDSNRVKKYIQVVQQEGYIAGWKICGTANGTQGMSCFASISAGELSTLIAVTLGTDGSLKATGLSGEIDEGTLKVGISSDDGSVYVYSDTVDLPDTATMTVIELDNPYGKLCHPVPVMKEDMPEMSKVVPTEWAQDKRVDFIMSIIPDTASQINKLVDMAMLDFEEESRRAEDDQIKSRLSSLEADSHTHANKSMLDNYGPAGSSSVPVYIDNEGKPTACYDDFARDSDMEAEEKKRNEKDVALKGMIDAINVLIPDAAKSSNQLADKAYVDDLGERLEAHYLGCNPDGAPFPTNASLFPPEGVDPPVFYYQGVEVQPNVNDVTIVTYDTEHTTPITTEAATTRYRYDGSQWTFEYVINNNALNQNQLLSINSGITDNLVAAYNDHIHNIDKHVSTDDRNTWNTKVSQDQLGAETASRIAGDEASAKLVSDEAAAREAADTEEAAARTAAVNSLDTRVTALEAKGLVVESTRLTFG